MENKNGYVYILKDQNGKFYIGSTDNIERRLKQHKYKHTQTTGRMKNPELALLQKYESLNLARKIELKIKKMKRKDYIQKMIDNGCIKLIM